MLIIRAIRFEESDVSVFKNYNNDNRKKFVFVYISLKSLLVLTDGFVENPVTIMINIRWDHIQDHLKFIFKNFVISPMSDSLPLPKHCCKTALEYKPLMENLKPHGNGSVIEFALHFLLLFVFLVFFFLADPIVLPHTSLRMHMRPRKSSIAPPSV